MKIVSDLKKDAGGSTSEQNNIADKITTEADPDKVWHLYVISPFTGEFVLQSTVKGKITSSNKRLTPRTVTDGNGRGMVFVINGQNYYTDEMPSEDGTFGSSSEYIYWTDTKGRRRRHFVTGGQIIHVTDQSMTMVELSGE